MRNSYEERHYEDNGKAWDRLSRGDGGHKPGDRFPTNLGTSEAAQRFKALNGSSETEFLQSLLGFTEEPHSYKATPYRWKRSNPKKTDIYRAENSRRTNCIAISMDDPFVIPREIDKDEFLEAYSAVSYANELGYILNVSLTICWEMLGVKPKKASRDKSDFHDLLIHPLRNWLKNKCDFYWIYTNEYSQKSGFHTHYLLHIPREHAESFNNYIAKRIKKINKNPDFNHASFKLRFNKCMDLQKQWIRFQYLCKGINRYQSMKHISSGETVYIEDLISFRYENPGNNHAMRRIAHSQNLNKNARRASSFESPLEKSILDINVLYPHGRILPKKKTETETLEPLNFLNL